MVPADTVVTIRIPGGGGYGPAFARDPARVLADVRDGYVSLQAARAAYGVVIDPATWTIDEAATAALRDRRPG
jgi:N-methylhydantoinase B